MPLEPGVVSEKKLRELLAEQHESDAVEYKDVWNLDDRRHVVELALAVGAMQSLGGYIVVGVDGRARTTGNLTDRHVILLDPATVDDKVGKYLPPPIELRIAHHKIDNANVVLIYIERRAEGLTAFLRDGTYQDDAGKTAFVFREGDVYTRRGTKTTKARQQDIIRAFAERSGGEPVTLGWDLPSADFERAFGRALHEYDGREAKTLVRRAPAVAKERLAQGVSLVPLADRLTQAALVLVDDEPTLGNLGRLREIVEAFAGIYELALDDAGNPKPLGEMAPHDLWTEIVVRLYAIGAYAVRVESWYAVPVVVARDTRAQRVDHGDLFSHWRRHATDHGLTDGREIPIQHAASEFVGSSDWARPDGAEADATFESVCAFDQLASLVYAADAVADGFDLELAALYGNAGLVGVEQGDPILVRLLDDQQLRQAVFPYRDQTLRRALQLLLRYARQEAHDAGRSRFQFHTWVEIDRFIGGDGPSRSAPPLEAPDVVLGHPSYQPVFATGADEKRYVSTLKPRYLIENKSSDLTVRDVTTGIRTRDGRELAFEAFRAPALRPGETAIVEHVEVPYEYLAGLHESAVGTVILYWARFIAPDGVHWRVLYDPATRDHEYIDE